MKKAPVVVIVMTILLFFASCSKSSEQEKTGSLTPGGGVVTWYNFNDGLKLAQEKRKPIIMDFYADWCGWCRKMETEVFADREVAARLKDNYVCIRIHTDRDQDETIKYKNHVLTKREFSMMVGVQGLPTLVFMDKEGNLITKIPGFMTKDMLLPLLNYIREECYQKKIPFKDYVDGKTPCNGK
jgi:thioredoxin-related protein